MNHASERTSGASFAISPVGIVRCRLKTPMLKAGEDGLALDVHAEAVRRHRKQVAGMISELVIDPEYEEMLDGIEGFSHILVIYWPHLIDPARRVLKKVHPMGRKDIPKQGIFATCSPARPNPLLITAVRLIERKGHSLRVMGLEAVDGSPVLDIKPYNPDYYRVETPVIAAWMKQIQREAPSEE